MKIKVKLSTLLFVIGFIIVLLSGIGFGFPVSNKFNQLPLCTISLVLGLFLIILGLCIRAEMEDD